MRAYVKISVLPKSAVNAVIDNTQKDERCCGSYGYQSWRALNTTWARAHPKQLAPTSCCVTPSRAGCNNIAGGLYQRGCTGQLKRIYEKSFLAIYAVGGTLTLLAFIEVLTACYMARSSNTQGMSIIWAIGFPAWARTQHDQQWTLQDFD